MTNEANLLYRISRQLNSDLDINRVMAEVLHLTLECVGANIGSVLILDEQGAVAHKILARQNMPAEKAEMVVVEVIKQGLAGWVIHQRQGAIIADVMSDRRWVNFPDDEFVGGSALGVPLIRRERLVGVITLRHSQPNYFTDEHLALLSSIAEQSVIAVENARLFHSVQGEKAKLKAIIDGAGDAIIVTDPAGHILLMNALARKIFGVSQTEEALAPHWQGWHLLDVIDNPSLSALWHSCALSQSCSQEIPFQDGSTFQANISHISNVGHAIILHDITYLKQLDQLKNDFVSAISHDLRSPLQLIYTYTSLLLDEGTMSKRQVEFIEGINRSAKKMSDLLNDLLDLARVNAGVGMQKEICDLKQIIFKVSSRFEEIVREKGLILQSHVDANLPYVEANANRIDQVLSNLLDNAIKYTLAGSIVVQATADARQVYIRVTDTGIGLKPEERAQLFGRFYRAKNEMTKGIEGTGLGLVIAKSIVEQYGGQMWVESTWQKGSTFIVSLPSPDLDEKSAGVDES